VTVTDGRAFFDGKRRQFLPELHTCIAKVHLSLQLATRAEFEAAMTETNTLSQTYVGTWIGASWGTTTPHHPKF